MNEIVVLEPIYEGSTFAGAEIAISEEVDGALQPVPLAGADIVMNMVRNEAPYASYKTSDNTLLVAENKIIIPKHTPTLPSGTYTFDFSIKLGNDTQTGVAPGTWEIKDPITKR